VRATLAVIQLMIGILAVFPVPLLGQEVERRVSMREALRLFGENSLALRIARAEASEIEGLARQSRGYANPSFTFVREDLGKSGEDYSETIIGVQQQLEWPGRTSARGRAAGHAAGAANAGYRADSVRLAFDVREAYAEAWASEERVRAIAGAADVIGRVADAAERRLEEGDISGYEARRLRLERVRIEGDLAVAELESMSARRTLATLVMPGDEAAEVGPANPIAGVPPAVQGRTAISAVATRPDVEAAARALEAAEARVTAASSGWVPDPLLGLGYKDQADGFTGVELTLAIPIPLFDQRDGAHDAARSRQVAAGAGLDLLTREARNDVLAASARHESSRARLAGVGEDLLAEADALREAAEVAYEEGEMTLVELLDAARAFRDTRLMAVRLRADSWIAYYDLLRAMGRAPEEAR